MLDLEDMEYHASHMLFVYGTLMQGMGNAFSEQLGMHSEFAGKASTHGELYDYHHEYPCAVSSIVQQATIQGECYRLADPEALLPRLDAYEDCFPGDPSRSLYVRCIVPVTLESNAITRAWMYFWNRSLDGLTRIAEGDYKTHYS